MKIHPSLEKVITLVEAVILQDIKKIASGGAINPHPVYLNSLKKSCINLYAGVQLGKFERGAQYIYDMKDEIIHTWP